MLLLAIAAPSAKAQTQRRIERRVTVVTAEREYDTHRTLRSFANKHLEASFRVRFVSATREQPNQLPGLDDALRSTDVVVLSVRRRAPTLEQMTALRRYLAAGGALVAIRTSSHAFDTRGKVPDGHADWPSFDRDVLGASYEGHYGNKRDDADRTRVWRIADGPSHPFLRAVPRGKLEVRSWLYKHRELAKSAQPLLMGKVGKTGREEPVAWTRVRPDGGRVFYTSLGHPQDFAQPWFAGMLRGAIDWAAGARSPQASWQTLRAPDDLAIDLVLSEPTITQPVFVNFDERGRMWVVEYRQYPHPAGLKILSRDRVWRNVYDRVPPPPPHAKGSPFRGADRISIHEDTNGDGTFDKSKVFLDGLNLCTAVAHGRGGVFVLSPPYLLFYADRDRNDEPDGDGRPVVHLSGFGLEDTHSIANSLRWGPDGWLYGAQGSTVSSDIIVVGKSSEPYHTQGQHIWRYHPDRREFEVFSEGGGNAFGCEIDTKGRVFSGHNGGNTRGFHYPQGGYLRKGFHKHGALSNPYAFGFFPHMPHGKVARFTHNFIVYEGHTLPARYRGRLFGVDPLNRYVPIAERIADGATFRTRDIGKAIHTDDEWFRPVDIKHGPDGAVYVCDWYDAQVSHYGNHEGKIDKSSGRVYRVRAREHVAPPRFDLGNESNKTLIATLAHANRWHRETARRVLADRSDEATFAALRRGIAAKSGQLALESLWTLYASGGFTDEIAAIGLTHVDPHVRAWSVRLIGDDRTISPTVLSRLLAVAGDEPNAEVRSQLAATAKRLPARACAAVFSHLVGRDSDRADRYIPLQLWWALESVCSRAPDLAIAAFSSSAIWSSKLVREHLLWRVMRRFAATGKRSDLLRCARLLELAPDPDARRSLLDGFEQAFKGRAMTGLPTRLATAISKADGATLALRARRGERAALEEALRLVADPNQPSVRRETYIELLAELREPRVVPALLQLLRNRLAPTALAALEQFDAPEIATAVLTAYPDLSESAAEVARNLFAARAEWTAALISAANAGKVDKATFSADAVARMRRHEAPEIQAGLDRLWGKQRKPTSQALRTEIRRIKQIVTTGKGDPYRGKPLFLARCATCHQLYTDGREVGPDLTNYVRGDLDSMLLAIVDPAAEIREGFEQLLVTMKDGRILVGSKADQDGAVLVLRSSDGQPKRLPRRNIESIEPIAGSQMPFDLLTGMTKQQLRDLFAYLRTTQPQIK